MVNCFNTALNISINNGILENISNPLLCFSVASQNKEKVVRDFLVDLFQNSRIKQRLVQAHFKHFNFRYGFARSNVERGGCQLISPVYKAYLIDKHTTQGRRNIEVLIELLLRYSFASYSTTVKRVVALYFREKEITLKNLTAKDIQEFYMKELQRVSASSVIHYHANIHKALKYAVKIDLIDVNPADKVERPKKDRYVGSFYDADEVNALFEAAKGSKLELPILFGAFYGLRRSEAIGLKWDAIICPPAGQSKRIPAKRIC